MVLSCWFIVSDQMRHFGNKLDEILAEKMREVEVLLPRLGQLKAQARRRDDFRSLWVALGRGLRDQEINEGYGIYPMAVIAEVKKASPSAGVIAESFDPVQVAVEYEEIGADAISVLTDKNYFQGDLSFLQMIREKVKIPLLRKDFIIHESQIYEAVVAGADAILLIVAALEQDELAHLYDVAQECQLDVLVEVHNLEEMDRAMETDARIIGINNRNLRTFEVSLKTTEQLSEEAGTDCILISESGIQSREDAALVKAWGADAVLVGEALMRAKDKAAMMADLKVL